MPVHENKEQISEELAQNSPPRLSIDEIEGSLYGHCSVIKSHSSIGWTHVTSLTDSSVGEAVWICVRLHSCRTLGKAMFLLFSEDAEVIQGCLFANAITPMDMHKYINAVPTNSIVAVHGVIAKVQKPIERATMQGIEIAVRRFYTIEEGIPTEEDAPAPEPALSPAELSKQLMRELGIELNLDDTLSAQLSDPTQCVEASKRVPKIFSEKEKLHGWEFYRKIGSPKFIVAPMVDGSELPFRMLCRKYGAHLAYSPMFHSALSCTDERYRREHFDFRPEDRPLFVQFSANDPAWLLKAAMLVQDNCDAVDINFGCPQRIAKSGFYGSFLMERWDIIFNLVSTLHKHLSVPVTCKIRIYESEEKTIAYARMLEAAGCAMLTVHGRLREQKGHKMGLANWDMIRKVRESVSIPVIANGNIRHMKDVEDCLEATGCVAVMSAESLLHNPALFSPTADLNPVAAALEYFDFVEKYPTQLNILRGHLFWFLNDVLAHHPDLRFQIAEKCSTFEQYKQRVIELKQRCDEQGSCLERLEGRRKNNIRRKEAVEYNEEQFDGAMSIFD